VSANLAHSVQARLVNHAHKLGIDPNVVLARYAAERLLYRLSVSPHAERFVLKGALMLLVWLGETIRPTRDADLLGYGALDAESLRSLFAELCTLSVHSDALVFDAGSVRVAPIRPHDVYGGQRVALVAQLGKARLRVQVDVGIGDIVVPGPVSIEYPSLLDLPRPRLRAYRPETAIAEKLHAMVELDSKNSRMRDFFDIQALAARENFDGSTLASAITATFERRRTLVPRKLPLALTPAFAAIDGKRSQWRNFMRRVSIAGPTPELETVIAEVAAFAGPLLVAVGPGQAFQRSWQPGGPWR
jgi:hypothetical protein